MAVFLNILTKYELLISILLIPILIPVLITIFKTIKNRSGKIEIQFSFQSSMINKNNCFNKITLINHTSKTFTINHIDVIFFDDKFNYKLCMYNLPFKLEANEAKSIDIKPVSYYAVGGTPVDFINLFINKQFYFKLSPLKHSFFVEKSYIKRKFKSLKSLILKIKEVSIMDFEFEGVSYSLGWTYGVVYKDSNKISHVGFFNENNIGLLDGYLPPANGFKFNPIVINNILSNLGFMDIKVKQLTPAINMVAIKLGIPPKMKPIKTTKDGIPIINLSETKEFRKTTGI